MYAIGTQFIRQAGKRKDVETIEDIYTTTNSAGEVVNTRYVASHDFMGQKVFDYDVCAVTIARGKLDEI